MTVTNRRRENVLYADQLAPLEADREWPDAAAEQQPAQRLSSLRSFFGLTAVGLVFAALCGVALSWDGAAYLFRTLDNQAPFTPNTRLINWPLHWPVIIASRFTSDLPFLQTVFGLTYAAFPLLMLAAAWWIVREEAPTLFVWAAFGIGLGMLPGKIYFVSEANLAVQLAWPLILAILVGLQRKHAPLVVVLAVGLYNTHPLAVAFFAVATALAFGMGLRERSGRRWLWGWAAGFGGLTLAGVVGFLFFRSDYERGQSSLGQLGGAFQASVAGLPLLGLIGSWVAALLVLLAPLLRRAPGQRADRVVFPLAVVSLGVATALLVAWAQDPQQWRLAALFSRWTAVVALTFMLPAAIEGALYAPTLRHRLRDYLPQRARVIQVVAAASSLVLIVQSVAWLNLTSRLRETVARSPWACVSAGPIEWLDNTPLDYWTTAQHSILLQGRAPQRVMLTGDLCGQVGFERGIPLDPFFDTNVVRVWNGGWFDLQGVRQGVAAELAGRPGCSFALTTGWHRTETAEPFWWRWSDGREAQIRVVMDRAGTVVLGGQLETAKAPNRVEVLVNGQRRGGTELAATGLAPVAMPPLALQAGVNTIQFVSQNPPIPANPDGRPLGLSVANLSMSIDGAGQPCAFHP